MSICPNISKLLDSDSNDSLILKTPSTSTVAASSSRPISHNVFKVWQSDPPSTDVSAKQSFRPDPAVTLDLLANVCNHHSPLAIKGSSSDSKTPAVDFPLPSKGDFDIDNETPDDILEFFEDATLYDVIISPSESNYVMKPPRRRRHWI